MLTDAGREYFARNGYSVDQSADVPPPADPPTDDDSSGMPDNATDREAETCTGRRGLRLKRLSDVKPETVSWLWPNRIPRGKLVTLDGDPGLGKSTLALAIAATVTTGGQWPDGTRCEYPGDVLLLSAEDGLADTVRPRLDAAGADVGRVHAIEGMAQVSDTGEVTLRPPTVADVDELRAVVESTGARLLIVDVLMAYMPGGVDSHKDQDIRRVLSRLAELAERTGCTILLLRHLNKAAGRDPLYRGGGSIGIVGAARLGLIVASDPDDENRRVLATTKNNLGPRQPSLVYQLVPTGEHGAARVDWLGVSEHDARELLADAGGEGASSADEARDWLQDYLTEQGRCPSSDAKAQGRKAGFSERTIQRTASKLRVIAESSGFPRRTYWSLPVSSSGANGPEVTPGPQGLGATGATGTTGRDQQGCEDAFGATAQSRQSRQQGVSGATESPLCIACAKPVVAGQGDLHLSCRPGGGGDT